MESIFLSEEVEVRAVAVVAEIAHDPAHNTVDGTGRVFFAILSAHFEN